MVCAVCLWLVSMKKLVTVAAAATTIRGTALCRDHAVRKLDRLQALQDLGLR